MSNANENLTPAQLAAVEAAAIQMASMTTQVEVKTPYRPSWKVIVGALLGTAVVGGGVYFAVSRKNAKNRAQVSPAEAAAAAQS
jgi:hypothetical protein